MKSFNKIVLACGILANFYSMSAAAQSKEAIANRFREILRVPVVISNDLDANPLCLIEQLAAVEKEKHLLKEAGINIVYLGPVKRGHTIEFRAGSVALTDENLRTYRQNPVQNLYPTNELELEGRIVESGNLLQFFPAIASVRVHNTSFGRLNGKDSPYQVSVNGPGDNTWVAGTYSNYEEARNKKAELIESETQKLKTHFPGHKVSLNRNGEIQVVSKDSERRRRVETLIVDVPQANNCDVSVERSAAAILNQQIILRREGNGAVRTDGTMQTSR